MGTAKEITWDFSKVVAVVGSEEDGREKCSRQLAQGARRNVKFLLNPAEIVRYTARNVFQNVKRAAKGKFLFQTLHSIASYAH